MNYLKKTGAFFLIISLIVSFTFCSKDEDDRDPMEIEYGRYYKLYNKMWYNLEGQQRGDHYFKPTDSIKGTFEVDHPYMPDYTGDYQWYPTGDSMLVKIGNTFLAFYFKDISDHTMSYAPSNEPENIYLFADTKP